MSFWSLILEPGKKYEKEVENGIQVTRAALDTSRASDNDGIVQIILEFEGKEMTVANLSVKHGIFQSTLDLAFKEGDKVAFSTSGAKVPVSLTGYAGLEDDDDLDDEELEDLDEDYLESTMDGSDEDDEDAPELVSGRKKRKLEVADKFKRPAKSAKLANGSAKGLRDLSSMGEELLGEEEELDDDTLDSDDDDEDDDEEDDDDDDEEEDEDDDSEDAEEEEIVKEIKSKMNGVSENQKQKKKDVSSVANGTLKALQLEAVKNANKDKKKTPVKKSPTKDDKAVTGTKTPSKDKSPKENKAKAAKVGKTEDVLAKTPKSEKKKQHKESQKETPKATADDATPNKKQMRSGGVMIEDITVGTGEAARKGSNVSMYYVGRLKSNNKIFDSQLSGTPLKFVLGRGEVIQGWDVGLIGMKVGGKRKLSIPSAMAYGKKGAPPEIPPQANLEFEVTMMGCR
ncbi:46 kDa FK506-binding nuclear protein isoform X2 [Hyalella azteca]|uniref:FK506-binding protein n=1 Tax=Hyalella azteca TaxID=294128 RepID=A0A8B7PL96_HYAAZ|nr:46 kDa FK506-binding nuclear protein isoform X2 [Hyalella azteca]